VIERLKGPARLLVEEDAMAMAERATLDVLAREAHRVPFQKQ